LLGFHLLAQRFDDWIEVAFHDLRQLVQAQADSVVGHAALRVVVGADALGTIAAPHLRAALLGAFALAAPFFSVEQARPQQ